MRENGKGRINNRRTHPNHRINQHLTSPAHTHTFIEEPHTSRRSCHLKILGTGRHPHQMGRPSGEEASWRKERNEIQRKKNKQQNKKRLLFLNTLRVEGRHKTHNAHPSPVCHPRKIPKYSSTPNIPTNKTQKPLVLSAPPTSPSWPQYLPFRFFCDDDIM